MSAKRGDLLIIRTISHVTSIAADVASYDSIGYELGVVTSVTRTDGKVTAYRPLHAAPDSKARLVQNLGLHQLGTVSRDALSVSDFGRAVTGEGKHFALTSRQLLAHLNDWTNEPDSPAVAFVARWADADQMAEAAAKVEAQRCGHRSPHEDGCEKMLCNGLPPRTIAIDRDVTEVTGEYDPKVPGHGGTERALAARARQCLGTKGLSPLTFAASAHYYTSGVRNLHAYRWTFQGYAIEVVVYHASTDTCREPMPHAAVYVDDQLIARGIPTWSGPNQFTADVLTAILAELESRGWHPTSGDGSDSCAVKPDVSSYVTNNGAQVVSYITTNGTTRCVPCADGIAYWGAPVMADSNPHNGDQCDMCNRPVTHHLTDLPHDDGCTGQLSTDKLRNGDRISLHGMEILLEGEPAVNTGHKGRDTYTWHDARIVAGTSPVPGMTYRWPVSGNDLALWWVKPMTHRADKLGPMCNGGAPADADPWSRTTDFDADVTCTACLKGIAAAQAAVALGGGDAKPVAQPAQPAQDGAEAGAVMSATVAKDDLVNALNHVTPMLPRPADMQDGHPMTGIRIAVDPAGVVTVTAFGFGTAAHATLDAQTFTPGAVLVPGAGLAGMVKAFGGSDTVTVAESDDRATVEIACGTAAFTLGQLDLAKYDEFAAKAGMPTLPDTIGTIALKPFASMVARVAVSAGTDATLPMMQSVYVVPDVDRLTFDATDRYRLGSGELNWNRQAANPEVHKPREGRHAAGMAIPGRELAEVVKRWAGLDTATEKAAVAAAKRAAKAAKAAKQAAPGVDFTAGQVAIGFTGGPYGYGVIGLTFGRFTWITKLIDHSVFPPVRQLYPTDYPVRGKVDAVALTDAINRVKRVAIMVKMHGGKTQPMIDLSWSADTLTVSAGQPSARLSESIPCAFDGAPDGYLVRCNPSFLAAGLTSAIAEVAADDDKTVTLGYTEPTKPFVIGPDETVYQCLIMPVRIGGDDAPKTAPAATEPAAANDAPSVPSEPTQPAAAPEDDHTPVKAAKVSMGSRLRALRAALTEAGKTGFDVSANGENITVNRETIDEPTLSAIMGKPYMYTGTGMNRNGVYNSYRPVPEPAATPEPVTVPEPAAVPASAPDVSAQCATLAAEAAVAACAAQWDRSLELLAEGEALDPGHLIDGKLPWGVLRQGVFTARAAAAPAAEEPDTTPQVDHETDSAGKMRPSIDVDDMGAWVRDVLARATWDVAIIKLDGHSTGVDVLRLPSDLGHVPRAQWDALAAVLESLRGVYRPIGPGGRGRGARAPKAWTFGKPAPANPWREAGIPASERLAEWLAQEPAAPIATPEPVTVPEPAAPIATPEPAAPIATPEPVTVPEPAAPIATPEPVTVPEPAAPIATPEPVTVPEPAAPIATPEPVTVPTPAPVALDFKFTQWQEGEPVYYERRKVVRRCLSNAGIRATVEKKRGGKALEFVVTVRADQGEAAMPIVHAAILASVNPAASEDESAVRAANSDLTLSGS